MEDIPLSALIGALVVLHLISAFFSTSETSMMALNRYRLRHLAMTGHRGARLTSELLAKTDKLLAVILLCNCLVNAAVAALATVMALRFFRADELTLSLATVLVTFTLLVFSEITPKVVAAAYAERIAYPAAYVLTPLLWLLQPVIWFVNLFVRALLWLLRINPELGRAASKLSMEELRQLVLEAGHFIPKRHQTTLLNLMELETITVDDVMIPRNQIEAIDLDAELDEIKSQLATSYHTRLPAFHKSMDQVLGVIHVRQVLNLLHTGAVTKENIKGILAEPYYIPSGTPLFTQIQQFQDHQRRLGLVVDEYGEIKGLVALEDILEEVIGEFTTQSPLTASAFERQPDGSFIVEGSSLLRDLNRKLGIKLPLDGPKTLNGLILEYLQDIPEAGTSAKIAGYPLEIVQVQDRSIKVVRIYPARR